MRVLRAAFAAALVTSALVVVTGVSANARPNTPPGPIETYKAVSVVTVEGAVGAFPVFTSNFSGTQQAAHVGRLTVAGTNTLVFYTTASFPFVVPCTPPGGTSGQGLLMSISGTSISTAPDGSQVFSHSIAQDRCAGVAELGYVPVPYQETGTSVTTGGTGRFEGACSTGQGVSYVDPTTDPISVIIYSTTTSFTC